MRELILGDNHIFLVDDDDYDRVAQYHWTVTCRKSGHIYAHRSEWRNGKCNTIYLHRLIIDAPKGKLVDHIDRDTLNNSKSNLRIATKSQNNANSKLSKRNTTGYRGVVVAEPGKTWHAEIRDPVRGKRKYLGRFKSPLAAALAFDAAALHYYGEFASLNFPDEVTTKYMVD